MTCPRCGECLTTFALGERETEVCESCSYVGIPADHRPESQGESESWDAALQRFLDDVPTAPKENTPPTDEADDRAGDG